jgi:hypothetical protein
MNLSGYEIVLRSNRRMTKSGKGGGVVIYANSDVAKIVENTLKYDFQVSRKNIKHVTVIAVYRSPNTSSEHDTILVNYLYTIPDNLPNPGRLNLPKINWDNLAAAHNSPFADLVQNTFLEQHTLPTHQAGNMLDLVFTNDNEILHCGVGFQSALN